MRAFARGIGWKMCFPGRLDCRFVAAGRWHDGEDQALARYLARSAAIDRTAAWLLAVVPRGWLSLGLSVLAPAFAAGHGSPTALALGLGGTLLAYRAFHKLVTGMTYLAGAPSPGHRWRRSSVRRPAPRRAAPHRSSSTPVSGAGSSNGAPTVLEAHELIFRYRAAPVLQGCNPRIRVGDRLLLEGRSGGGKSTMASLLSNLRVPEAGLLLLRGSTATP